MKPILFNTEMVRAILDGRKTVTRRIVKPQPEFHRGETGAPVMCDDGGWCFQIEPYTVVYDFYRKPPCHVGDILYVRETWAEVRYAMPKGGIPADFKETGYLYRADGEIANSDGSKFKWKPSLHMPKVAARIFLRVKSVRVERLQDMKNDPNSAYNEGAMTALENGAKIYSLSLFERLWNSTIKPADLPKFGWDADPWVWVIEFERCEKPGRDVTHWMPLLEPPEDTVDG